MPTTIKEVLKGRTVEALAELIRKELKHKPATLQELSSRFDRGTKQIKSALDYLAAKNIHVEVTAESAEIVKDLPVGGEYRVSKKLLNGKRYRFGFTSDNHLASKCERLDVLNALFDRYQRDGITDVFQAGNIVDGICRFNRFDLQPSCSSLDGQVQYLVKHWPRRKGIVTRFIVGDDHEGWWSQREGINVGMYIQDAFERAGRTDLVYLGYMEADVRLAAPRGETWIRIQHAGGGSAYAFSYTSQKIVESFQGGEKPGIVLIGHYHKADFCMPREVFAVQGGCTQDQTTFMRKNKIAAHVGGWICELEQAEDGHVSAFQAEFMRFYDRKFYEGEKYPRW